VPWYLFLWDVETEAHLAEHGVTPDEFEEVVSNPDSVGESRSTGRPIAFGYTRDGKYLACVYELIDEDTVLPLTSYEVDE
jgi:uncharacterized DUF497 family protein